jgi:hypothetical protein
VCSFAAGKIFKFVCKLEPIPTKAKSGRKVQKFPAGAGTVPPWIIYCVREVYIKLWWGDHIMIALRRIKKSPTDILFVWNYGKYMQSASNMIALFITPQFYVWYTLAYNFRMLGVCVLFLCMAPVGECICNNATVTGAGFIQKQLLPINAARSSGRFAGAKLKYLLLYLHFMHIEIGKTCLWINSAITRIIFRHAWNRLEIHSGPLISLVKMFLAFIAWMKYRAHKNGTNFNSFSLLKSFHWAHTF